MSFVEKVVLVNFGWCLIVIGGALITTAFTR